MWKSLHGTPKTTFMIYGLNQRLMTYRGYDAQKLKMICVLSPSGECYAIIMSEGWKGLGVNHTLSDDCVSQRNSSVSMRASRSARSFSMSAFI